MEPLLVTPERRANWARLVSSNHPYYQKVLDGARGDGTTITTDDRYVTQGRWSALAYQMNGDWVHARASLSYVMTAGKSKDLATVLDGNDLRESGTDYLVTLSWIAAQLSDAEQAAWRDWIARAIEAYLASTIRLNDSDQVVGTYFCLATFDRLFGTNYRAHPKAVLMREAVRKFVTVLAEGGQWPEGSDYSLGTLNLLFTGAEAAGEADYPEIVAYRESFFRYLPHHYTTDLRDSFEHEDEQTRNNPRWDALETLLAYGGQFYPQIRQLEDDLRAAWNLPAGNPMYMRYFIWADPTGPRAEWRDWAGTYAVCPGVGQVTSRLSWTDPKLWQVWTWYPPYSLGSLDHDYRIFGEIRIRADGKWVRDRPQAYSGSVLLGNHTIIGGLGAPTEIGVFTGATRIGDAVTYSSGTNAGVLQTAGRTPIPTLVNERTVSTIHLMDRNVIIRIERIHLTDTVDLARFAEPADKPKILAAPLLETLWQSQTVNPTVTDGVIHDDGRAQPLYPCTITVVDEKPLNLGNIVAAEKGWYSSVTPTTVQKFQILVTLLGEADVTIETLGDVQRIRVKKAGFRDAVIYSSAKPGPVLTTTVLVAANGGKSSLHDPSKVDGILAARVVAVDESWADSNADVYVEQPNGLEPLAAPPADDLLLMARAEIEFLTGELNSQRALVAAAEGKLDQVRAVVA